MAAGPVSERNQDATIYVGGLDEKVTEPLLWELFVQGGPVVNVHMPKDRITLLHQGYGFIEFLSEDDADYACKIMNMIKLYGKPIRVNKASAHQKNLDVGANIFIGNLDPEVDEKLLYDTFSAFGVILQTPKIMRDPTTGNSKGFAFINFASFDASDAAIEAMNGQYLCNRPITISYAFKKDSKGERHGSAAERLLAAQNPLAQTDRPHQLFADAPPIPPQMANIGMTPDLVHHVRQHLPMVDLARAVHLFSKNVHDESLPTSIQTMSCKLLLNLVECIRQRSDVENGPGRELLIEMLEVFVLKFKSIVKLQLPTLMGTKNNKPDNCGPSEPPSSPSLSWSQNGSHVPASSSPSAANETKTEDTRSSLILLDSSRDEKEKMMKFAVRTTGPVFSITECRSLVKTLVCGVKTITWGCAACKTPLDATTNVASTGKNLQPKETVIFIRLVQWAMKALDVYALNIPNTPGGETSATSNGAVGFPVGGPSTRQTVPAQTIRSKEEKEVLEHFAGVFAMMNPQTFKEVFATTIDYVVERIYRNSALQDPLVSSLNGSQTLVSQGLRTLELCVDNLQPDFLYEHIQPVRAELMQALWRTLRNPNDQIAHVAFRVLGKFGGGNRKMMVEPQRLDYFDKDSGPCVVIHFQELKHPVSLPVEKIMETAFSALKSSSTEPFYRTQCWEWQLCSKLGRFLCLSRDVLPSEFKEWTHLC
nr:EOG090X0BVS [Simocephalus serrulatus]